MRIAIDARTLNAPKTGDRTVTLGLVKGLIGLAEAGGLELVLVGRDPPPAGLLPPSPAVTVHVVPLPPGYRWMLSAFPRACREVAADVALIQYLGPFHSPCPLVTFVHDTVWRTLPATFPWRDRMILNAFLPGTIRRAAAVCTGSAFAAGEIARHVPAARGKLHVVPYAVDEQYRPVTDEAARARVRARYGLPERYVLSVGVLQPRKNVAGLIEAYGMLPPPVRAEHGLVIAGKRGWMVDAIVVATDAIEEPVRFTGHVPDEDLPALYSMASCFVYPSLYEGFGLPPLEAMACGTPVVTSNVASLPEVCGDAARLVDPQQPGEIADAIEELLTDAAVRADLIARGQAQAAQYSWTASARALLDVLQRAV